MRRSFVPVASLVLLCALGCSRTRPPGGGADAGGGTGSEDAAGAVDAGPGEDAGPIVRPDFGPVAGCTDPIDVVFVVDVSTSMASLLDSIRNGLGRVVDTASTLNSSVQFSLVVFVDDALAVNGCAPFATVSAVQGELDRWRAFCSSNRNPGSGAGSNMDCAENSLDALHLAATTCPWRAGATHVLIHVTDDTFVERPARLSDSFGDGVAVQHTYDEVVRELRAREVRAGVFAAPGMGDECGAGRSPDVGRGFHAPYNGRAPIPVITGGAVYDVRQVRAGTLDMGRAISELVMAEQCTLY